MALLNCLFQFLHAKVIVYVEPLKILSAQCFVFDWQLDLDHLLFKLKKYYKKSFISSLSSNQNRYLLGMKIGTLIREEAI